MKKKLGAALILCVAIQWHIKNVTAEQEKTPQTRTTLPKSKRATVHNKK